MGNRDRREYLMGIMVIKGIPHKWWEFWKYGQVGNFHGPKEEGRHIMHDCHDRTCNIASGGHVENPNTTRRDPLSALREMGEDNSADTMNEATNGQLSAQERTLLEINAVLWNGFCQLPKQYDTDVRDLRHHVDAINNIILARAASRANPDIVRKMP